MAGPARAGAIAISELQHPKERIGYGKRSFAIAARGRVVWEQYGSACPGDFVELSRGVPLSPVFGEPDPDGADCVACGRCCHHGPQTVHLLEPDEVRMGERLLPIYTELQDRPPHFRFVKNTGERCACLDVSEPERYPCTIYEVRPEDCRIVEPGSPACLEARRLGHLGKSLGFKRIS